MESLPEPASRLAPAGRVCAEYGCATVLSRYNDGEHCALHAPMQVPRMRGVKR
jgi:hypothetical protein